MFSVRPSKIHGKGCFANQLIRVGTVCRVPAYEVDEETWTSVMDEESGKIYEFYCPFKYLNHSSDPSAEVYLTDTGWEVYFLRDVGRDEEVTIYYGEDWDDTE